MVVIVVLGLFGDADQQCCDLPLLADVVHPSDRGLAYGIVDMVQCFFGFLATVIVGVLSEDVFGFVHNDDRPIKTWNRGTRSVNTHALGNALLVVNLVAMMGSLVLYIVTIFTYPRDAAWMARRIGRDGGGGGGNGDGMGFPVRKSRGQQVSREVEETDARSTNKQNDALEPLLG